MRIAFRAAGYEIFTCFFFLCLLKSRIGRGSTADPAGSRENLITEVCKKTDAPCRSVPSTEGYEGSIAPGGTCFYSNGFRDGRKQALRSGLAVPPHMAAPVISGIAVSAIPAVAATISAEITSASLTAEAAGASARVRPSRSRRRKAGRQCPFPQRACPGRPGRKRGVWRKDPPLQQRAC